MGADGQDCYQLTNDTDNIYACRGTFSGGMEDNSTSDICADGYHVCSNATEAVDFGLTASQCSGIIADGEIFFSRETSDGGFNCHSQYGDLSSNNNDVWGCAGSGTGEPVGVTCVFRSCLNFNIGCGNVNWYVDTLNEYDHISLSDSRYGGAL